MVKHAKIMFEKYEKTRTVSSQVMQQHEENIDFVTTALSQAVETQKEEIEHLHRTALYRINRYDRIKCFFIQNHHQRWGRIEKNHTN